MSGAPPLAGTTVVVTRPEHQARPFARLLEELGAAVVHLPLIAIADPESWGDLDAAIVRLREGAYDWIAFTSANAVDGFFRRAGRVPDGVSVAAVGASTAAALEARGAGADLVPAQFTLEALAEELGPGPARVLLPRVQDGPPLPRAFAAHGRTADVVTAYRNVRAPRAPAHEAVETGAFDAITFFSPSAVDAFADGVAWRGLGLGAGEQPARVVACIGPSTAASARRRGLRVDVQSAEHSARGLADALARLPSAS